MDEAVLRTLLNYKELNESAKLVYRHGVFYLYDDGCFFEVPRACDDGEFKKLRPPGNLCKEVESEGSRSPGWRPQARKCLERRVIARRSARDAAWSEPGKPHGRGFPGGLKLADRISGDVTIPEVTNEEWDAGKQFPL